MFRGRAGVGHSLSEPTNLKHFQNTYLPVGVCLGLIHKPLQ